MLVSSVAAARAAATTRGRRTGPRAQLLRVVARRAARTGPTAVVHPPTGAPVPSASVVGALLDHVSPALRASVDHEGVTARPAHLVARRTDAESQRRWRESGADDGALPAPAAERTLA